MWMCAQLSNLYDEVMRSISLDYCLDVSSAKQLKYYSGDV